MQRLIYLVVFVIMLSACANQNIRQSKENSVFLSVNVVFDLLSPKTFGRTINLVQVAQLETPEGNFELLFYLEISNELLTVVGVLPNGTRVFSVIYDGENIKSEGYKQVVNSLKPEYLLADLQLSLWPIEALRSKWLNSLECYKKGLCELFISPNGLERHLIDNEQVIITVNYDKKLPDVGKFDFKHHQRNYAILLETIEKN